MQVFPLASLEVGSGLESMTTEIIMIGVWKSLCKFGLHKNETCLNVLDFMAHMETKEFSLAISRLTHIIRDMMNHIVRLRMGTGEILNIPCFWSDHHLVQAKIRVFAPSCQGNEHPKLVYPQNSLNSLDFQLTLR